MKSILLLHGWNDSNYTSQTDSKDAWNNRQVFVDKLSKKYKIYKLNFPGFCGQKEPNKPWYLRDYVNYVFKYIKDNDINPDYILGYSFGGAVALLYNKMIDPNQKIVLVSPAIKRINSKSHSFISTPSFMEPIRSKLRYLYLRYIVKNPYILHGTKFLNESYNNIVRVDLFNDLLSINPKNITMIFGSKDNMVDVEYIKNNINEGLKKKMFIIKGGTHDIANSHPDDIISYIK